MQETPQAKTATAETKSAAGTLVKVAVAPTKVTKTTQCNGAGMNCP